jgi:hypothetical protein
MPRENLGQPLLIETDELADVSSAYADQQTNDVEDARSNDEWHADVVASDIARRAVDLAAGQEVLRNLVTTFPDPDSHSLLNVFNEDEINRLFEATASSAATAKTPAELATELVRSVKASPQHKAAMDAVRRKTAELIALAQQAERKAGGSPELIKLVSKDSILTTASTALEQFHVLQAAMRVLLRELGTSDVPDGSGSIQTLVEAMLVSALHAKRGKLMLSEAAKAATRLSGDRETLMGRLTTLEAVRRKAFDFGIRFVTNNHLPTKQFVLSHQGAIVGATRRAKGKLSTTELCYTTDLKKALVFSSVAAAKDVALRLGEAVFSTVFLENRNDENACLLEAFKTGRGITVSVLLAGPSAT